MARYGQAFKDKAVARLLPPESASLESVARDLSISAPTLERWHAEALSRPARERAWTAAARFEAVLVTAALDEAGKSAWCRERGVYPQELEQWRQAATQALAEPEDARASHRETKADRGRSTAARKPEQGGLRRPFAIWISRVLLPARYPRSTIPEIANLHEEETMLSERVIEYES